MMQEIKKLLIVEDNLPDSILLQEYLSKIPFVKAEIIVAERLAHGVKLDSHNSPDLIFLDLNLPDSNGIETFITVGKHFPDATIIVLSGLEDMEVALQAIQSGADDYLVKGELDENLLAKTISYSIERKKIQVKLKESEEMYRSLLENATEALIVMDIEKNKFINVSKTACSLFKVTEEELLQLQPSDIMPALQPDGSSSAQGVFDKINAAIAGEKPFFEWVFCNINGEEVPCEVRLVKLPSEDKLLIRGSIIDISERKKASEEINKFNDRFEMIARTTNDALWEWNLETGELWANQTHQYLYGLTMADPVPAEGQWEKKIHPDDRKKIIATQQQALASDKNVWISEYRFETKNGFIDIYDRTYIVRNAAGKAIRLTGTMMDITERKKAEQALAESENYLRTILDTEPECVKVLNNKGELLSMNPAGLAMIEADNEQQVLGHHMTELVNEKYRMGFNRLSKEVFNGNSGTFEFEVTGLKGGHRWLETHAVPLKDADGKIINLLGVTRDITEHKKVEKEITNTTDQLRQLTAHLQNIREEERKRIGREIHDELGQQLTVLKMDASWLRKKMGESDTAVRTKIDELIIMLDDTVKSVRRISSELRPSLLDDLGLIAAIEWQLGEFEKRSGISTSCIHLEEELEIPDNAKTAFFRIFQESLTNVARHSQAQKVIVSISEIDNQLVLSIEDNGNGFDKQKIADKKTLGILGMKERTAMIDGVYEISSTPGKGTIVTVKLVHNKTKTKNTNAKDFDCR